jgi:hypothetical protein
MDTTYILERLRSDSRHVCDLAVHEGQVGHPGVKGRFRELLLNNLLMPWLPASVGCGTGVIVDHRQQVIDAGQEDIILFDSLLAPPVLASPQSTHGVYLFDSVLCRIEVKSTLRKADLKSFVDTSSMIAKLELSAKPGVAPAVFGALNMLMAFESEVAAGQELSNLCEEMGKVGLGPTSGVVSAMCIADRGFWLLGKDGDAPRWKTLRVNDPGDPLSYFVGVISNSCFDQRARRQGLHPLGGGIGLYLDHPFDFVAA